MRRNLSTGRGKGGWGRAEAFPVLKVLVVHMGSCASVAIAISTYSPGYYKCSWVFLEVSATYATCNWFSKVGLARWEMRVIRLLVDDTFLIH